MCGAPIVLPRTSPPSPWLRGSGEGWARHFLLLFLGPGSRLAVESQRSGGMFCAAAHVPKSGRSYKDTKIRSYATASRPVTPTQCDTPHRRKTLTAHSNSRRENTGGGGLLPSAANPGYRDCVPITQSNRTMCARRDEGQLCRCAQLHILH